MVPLASILNIPALTATQFWGTPSRLKLVFLIAHVTIRFAADVFTEGLMLLARSINPSAPTLFHAPLSPHAKSYKPPKSIPNGKLPITSQSFSYDTSPAKLIWTLTPSIRVGIRYAETRLSDLICQNDCQALEFKGYGKNFITSHGFSPDAFVQMAFQAAYFGLYGQDALFRDSEILMLTWW
jgi:carnitine O-acetyltransferase